MKVAITSTGSTFESTVDRHFGHCSCFVIYNTQNKAIEFIPNPHKSVKEGAGMAAVKLLAEKGIRKIISGDFGIRIKPMLDSLKIQMIILQDPDILIQAVIDRLEQTYSTTKEE